MIDPMEMSILNLLNILTFHNKISEIKSNIESIKIHIFDRRLEYMDDISKLKYIIDRFKVIERSIDEIKIELMDFFIEVKHMLNEYEKPSQIKTGDHNAKRPLDGFQEK